MRWFEKWFERQSKRAWESAKNDDSVSRPKRKNRTNTLLSNRDFDDDDEDIDIIELHKSYTLRMQPATGGTAIQVSHYDNSTSEWSKDLYVVSETQDLGQEIKSILVQYRLKHN